MYLDAKFIFECILCILSYVITLELELSIEKCRYVSIAAHDLQQKKLNVTVIKQAISIYIQYIITVWNERDFLVVTFTAVLYPLN